MAHKGQLLRQLATWDQSCIKGEYSSRKESNFSHFYEKVQRGSKEEQLTPWVGA
jgi:hypothetical protein